MLVIFLLVILTTQLITNEGTINEKRNRAKHY